MKTESKPTIQPIIGKGLKLNLEVYHKLKAFQGGGEFWEHQSQMIIREHIGDFLPIMSVDESGKGVLCQMFVHGKEVASESKRAKGVPSKERCRLEAAIKALKQKADSPHIDTTTKKIINEFKLPDPLKDPELYRTYGSRWNPKLMVIWGCEKEFGTSIVPEEAPRRVARESVGAGTFRRLPWIVFILLLLIGGIWALNEYDLIRKDVKVTPAKDVNGNSVLDENGKHVPEREDKFPIAVRPDGKPIIDPNGNPLPADPEGNPIAVNPDNEVVRDADGKTLPPRADKFPVVTDEEGNPITGPDGNLLPGDVNGPLAVNAEDEVVKDADGKPLPAREDRRPVATDQDGKPITDPDDQPLPADTEGNPLAVNSEDEVVKDADGKPLPAREDRRPVATDEDGNPILDADGQPKAAELGTGSGKAINSERIGVLVVDGPVSADEIPRDGRITPKAPRSADGDEVNLAKLTRPAVVTIAVSNGEEGYSGQATGFIITGDGLVVTNHHVVAGGDSFVALLADGSALPVDAILVSDKPSDLALLRVSTGGRNLPFLDLVPEGSEVAVGQKIAVMGSPHGLAGTFTTGIISAKRNREGTDLIQITAPISPGSSGSPVVDDNASVVGVVTGAVVEDQAQSLNFAVDISELRELLTNADEAARKSVENAESTEAVNRKNPDDVPASAAVGSQPKDGKEISWDNDPIYDKGDPELPGGKEPVRTASGDEPEIVIKEISRQQLEEGKMRLVLAVRALANDGSLESLEDIKATLDGKELEVKDGHVILVAEQGSRSLEVSGNNPKNGKKASLSAEIDVQIKSSVDIKIKDNK